jgi:hypothetical protein
MVKDITLNHIMDSRQLTNLLTFIADNYEAILTTGSKFKPKFMSKMLLTKFPTLTGAQIKHILRII